MTDYLFCIGNAIILIIIHCKSLRDDRWNKQQQSGETGTEAIEVRKMEYRHIVISVWNKLISLTSVALDLWITTPAIWTVTHRPVLNGVTFCSWTTWVSYQTWVLATLTDARFISRTFSIWCAFRLRWNYSKILQLLISNMFKKFL